MLEKLSKASKEKILFSIFIVLAIEGIIFISVQSFFNNQKSEILSSQEVGGRVIDFVNQNLLRGAATASLVSSVKEKKSGLYKITIDIQGKKFESYASLDGRFLYPERLEMSPSHNKESSVDSKKACQNVKKEDNPLAEIFVVSNCPFGLQTQRVLAEIWKNSPSLLRKVKVRYIGSISKGKITSMHGDKEAQENLNQICVREEQADKYWQYVSCYIKKGDGKGCLKVAGIDIDKLNSCRSDSSRGLAYAKKDFDLQNKYQVSGSPTLILNGEKVNEFDFGGRTAEAVKTLLCCGFKNKPGVCSKELTASSAATGFSESYSSSSSGGSSGGSSQSNSASCQ
jgi:hypothetical protein